MNNTNEDVITYYDKSSAKYVIIDRKTGFSRYQSIQEFEKQNQFLKEKQTFCQTFGTRSQTKEVLHKENGFGLTLDDMNAGLEDSTQRHISETMETMKWSLRPDMRIDSSIKLDKHMIASDGCVRVIGQLDNKYILCTTRDGRGRSLVMVFDQHAVHERIRYEKILSDVYDRHRNIKSVAVLPPIDINIRFDGLDDTCGEYGTRVRRLTGFQLMKRSHGRDGYCLTQIPECLLDSLDMQSMVDIIEEALIIAKQTANDCSNGMNGDNVWTGSRLTPKLIERLQTKACRGAIRFGDPLKLHDCLKLINCLSECNVCFRCAHGRPSVAPLAFLPNSSHFQ